MNWSMATSNEQTRLLRYFCACLALLRAVSFSYGLDLHTRLKNAEQRSVWHRGTSSLRGGRQTCRRCLLISFRIVTLAGLIVAIAFTVEFQWLRVAASNKLSASDIFLIVNNANDIALMGQATRSLWLNQDLLSSMLDSVRETEAIYVWPLCWLFQVTSDWIRFTYRSAARPSRIALVRRLNPFICATCVHVRQVQHVAVLLYLQSQLVIRRQLRHVDFIVPVSHASELVRAKQRIRATISKLNATFGSQLASLYIHLFSLIYIGLIDEISRESNNVIRVMRLFRVGSIVLQIVVLYSMACNGTDIINLCCRTEFRAATIRRQADTSDELRQRLRRHLTFDEQQDCLTISDCFVHSKATFVSYVGILITCIGVLLQFDYKLMAKFDMWKGTTVFMSNVTLTPEDK